MDTHKIIHFSHIHWKDKAGRSRKWVQKRTTLTESLGVTSLCAWAPSTFHRLNVPSLPPETNNVYTNTQYQMWEIRMIEKDNLLLQKQWSWFQIFLRVNPQGSPLRENFSNVLQWERTFWTTSIESNVESKKYLASWSQKRQEAWNRTLVTTYISTYQLHHNFHIRTCISSANKNSNSFSTTKTGYFCVHSTFNYLWDVLKRTTRSWCINRSKLTTK